MAETKQCPKCMAVTYHTRFQRIKGDVNIEKVRNAYGVLLGNTTANVYCNMYLLQTEYNGKTKKYTLTWVCGDCKFKQVERNMSREYYFASVAIGSHTQIDADDLSDQFRNDWGK